MAIVFSSIQQKAIVHFLARCLVLSSKLDAWSIKIGFCLGMVTADYRINYQGCIIYSFEDILSGIMAPT